MSKIFVSFILLWLCHIPTLTATESLHPSPITQEWMHKVKKVSDSFYIGKIPGKKLWIVMEHIKDEPTRQQWLDYIRTQNNPRAFFHLPDFTLDGILHAKLVLEQVNISKNDVWMAYVTSNPDPHPILQGAGYAFANDIKMFVTVTSSPNALITSHMGISLSAEGSTDKEAKGISMDLHSFGAKVMKMLNPARSLMVNAPNILMEMIIGKAMPKGTVFVGTREMAEVLKTRPNATMDDFLKEHPNLFEEKENKIKESFLGQINREETNKGYALKYLNLGRLTQEEYEKNVKEHDKEIQKIKHQIETKTIVSHPHEGEVKDLVTKIKDFFEYKDDEKNYYELGLRTLSEFEEEIKEFDKQIMDLKSQLKNEYGFDSDALDQVLSEIENIVHEQYAFIKKYMEEQKEKSGVYRRPPSNNPNIEQFNKRLKIQILDIQVLTSWANKIHKDLEAEYNTWKTPYYFSHGWKGFETIDKLMAAYGPPLLSVDTQDGRYIKNTLIIFDKNHPDQQWLTIQRGDPNYDWIFTYPFSPAGTTHFIAADLDALADLKPLDD